MSSYSSFLIRIICFTLISICFAEEIFDLNGEWQTQRVGGEGPVYKAQVPGNIYSAVIANLNNNAYYRFNDVEYRWVANEDWSFWRNFQVPIAFKAHDRVLLKCDGLDTVADIYLNNKLVGTSDNQFRQYYFDIKDTIEATNVLKVNFRSPIKYAAEKFNDHIAKHNYFVPPNCTVPVQNGECHPNFIRKAQASFSWDWGPAFPTVGIWRDISIVAFNTGIIEAVTVNTSFSSTSKSWTLNLRVHLLTPSSPRYENVKITTAITELKFYASETVKSPSYNDTFDFTYDLAKYPIEKWWPNGYGDQKLYELWVQCVDTNTTELSIKRIKIGFRTVEVVEEPLGPNITGYSFYFRVNGEKIYAKGSNWIPAHAFQDQLSPEYIRWLLDSSVYANMNMLRVWGGGFYESDLFYRLCDELGILIWQDFMFAVALYPTTDEFLETVRTEVRDNVLRLQHHPSIALWAGNNENEVAIVDNWFGSGTIDVYRTDYVKLYIDVVRGEVLKHEISGRPYTSSSPNNGIKRTQEENWISKDPRSNFYGDAHFYSYFIDPWNWTVYPPTRFASEYGFQSWESIETLTPVSIPEDLTFDSRFANHRQHHANGQTEMLFEISQRFQVPQPNNSQTAFPAMVYLTQVNQAMGLKAQTEYYRRIQSTIFPDSSGSTQGALYWQLNSIWPCPSWSSIEFGGKWKMAHYYAKDFFEPVLLSPYLEQDNKTLKVTLINDLLTLVNDKMTLRVFGLSSGFTPKYSINVSVSQRPQRASIVYEINLQQLLNDSNCVAIADCFVVVELSSQKSVPNVLFLGSPKDAVIPNANIKIADVSQQDNSNRIFNLRLESDSIAPFVWIEAWNIPGRFSKNGHTQYAAHDTLVFYSSVNLTASQLSAGIRIMSLADSIISGSAATYTGLQCGLMKTTFGFLLLVMFHIF